jgi:uncharacterized protein YaaW (UPF0174 family)
VKDNSTRDLVELLQGSSEDDLYILMEYNFGKDCSKVEVAELVKEIKYNGSNDIAYLFRKFEGVEYSEIVRDVAGKLKVKYTNEDDEEIIEGKILVKVLEGFWEKASGDEKKEIEELFKDVGIKNMDFKAGFPLAALTALISTKAASVIFYKLAAIIANSVARQLLGHGIRIAMNQALSKWIGVFLGPVGWAISGLLIAIDIAGPAYRKTIPTVLQISYMRQKAKLKDLEWGEDEC